MKKFLDEVASKKPAPGGGSVSALAGTLSAALVNKVCLLTIGKKNYREVEEQFKQLNQEIVKLQRDLLTLVEKDAQAYQEVVKTKGSQTAIKRAAEVPLETAQKSLEVLKRALYASESGNQNLRSDAFCAIELATASIYSALENVRVNMPFIKDEKYLGELKDKVDQVLDGAETLVKP